MFFYCTTKIENYHKVGITSSLDLIKKRLTTYKSSNPTVKIQFFSEIGNLANDIEWSFKNKFRLFRIPNTECYKLDFNIIYKHFLKFQHKYNNLHSFWYFGTFYLSDYYVDKALFEKSYNFSEKNMSLAASGYVPGFFPIASLGYVKKDKKGSQVYNLRLLDINNFNLRHYRKKYHNHLEKNYWEHPTNIAQEKLNKFYDENLQIVKKISGNLNELTIHEDVIREEIFDIVEKKYKSLIKKYPKDKTGLAYWKKSEQREIEVLSSRLLNKIENNFKEKPSVTDVLDAISSIIPKNNPKWFLQILYQVMLRFTLRSPLKIRKSIFKIEQEINKMLQYENKKQKIDEAIKTQLVKKIKKTKGFLRIIK